MNAQDLLAKAIQAAASAKVLLDTGDADGACNRAYYAMYDAARAALLASGSPVEPEVSKTHSGLISAFSLHLVKAGTTHEQRTTNHDPRTTNHDQRTTAGRGRTRLLNAPQIF